MAFNSLPVELVEHILSYVVDRYWNNGWFARQTWGGTVYKLVSLQLVCSGYQASWQTTGQFHAILSKELLLKAHRWQLEEDTKTMSIDALSALFLTKLNMGMQHRTAATLHIRMSMNSFAIWKLIHAESTKHELYLRASCSTMIANKGARWAYDELMSEVTPKVYPSPSTSPSPSPLMMGASEVMKIGGCLTISAFTGELPIVKSALEEGIDPNEPHELYGYPLYAAAYGGHVDVIRLLIDAGADISLSTGDSGQPLEVAARHGHLEAVQFLLGHTADMGFALSDALVGDHEQVADYLLDQVDKVDVNATRKIDDAPILLAIKNGLRRIAMRLCAHPNLLPNVMSSIDDTPLLLAINEEWDDVVEALLSCPSINPNAHGRRRRTPLHHASKNGYGAAVRLLLSRDDVDVNRINTSGNTPLGNALINNDRSTALLLLEHPATEAHLGQVPNTPLLRAMQENNMEMIDILLQRPEILNSASTGEHALEYAIRQGKLPIVQRLLDLYHPDLNYIDEDGNNLVYRAIAARHPNVTQLLFSTGAVSLSLRSRGDTLLVAAARARCLETVQYLLSRGVDVNEMGATGTALCSAVTCRSSTIVNLFLERADVDVNSAVPEQNFITVRFQAQERTAENPFLIYVSRQSFVNSKPGNTPLIFAVRHSTPAIIKRLLDHKQVDPNRIDGSGRTPLLWALYELGDKRCMEAVQVLLGHAATDPNMADANGWTPLFLAVYKNYTAVVDMLLAHPNIDPNLPNVDGWTPLLIAVSCNHADPAARLLQHPRTDINMRLNAAQTPLELAVELGRDEILPIIAEAARQSAALGSETTRDATACP